jgi:hypothetical protein
MDVQSLLNVPFELKVAAQIELSAPRTTICTFWAVGFQARAGEEGVAPGIETHGVTVMVTGALLLAETLPAASLAQA